MTFFVNELPKTRNALDRSHWTVLVAEKKRWQYLIREQAANYVAPIPCQVSLTFRTLKLNDYDNLAARYKSPLDAMQSIGMLKNDSPDHIELRIKQERVKHRNEQGVLFDITEI